MHPVLTAILFLSSVAAANGPATIDPLCRDGLAAVSVDVRADNNRYHQDVVVNRADGSSTGYSRTNRGLNDFFRKFTRVYPSHWYTPEKLRDEIVLDGATGNGKFVEELNAEGVQAEGFDIHLSPEMSKPGEPFFQSDFLKIARPDESYTVIYLHHGPCSVPPNRRHFPG